MNFGDHDAWIDCVDPEPLGAIPTRHNASTGPRRLWRHSSQHAGKRKAIRYTPMMLTMLPLVLKSSECSYLHQLKDGAKVDVHHGVRPERSGFPIEPVEICRPRFTARRPPEFVTPPLLKSRLQARKSGRATVGRASGRRFLISRYAASIALKVDDLFPNPAPRSAATDKFRPASTCSVNAAPYLHRLYRKHFAPPDAMMNVKLARRISVDADSCHLT